MINGEYAVLQGAVSFAIPIKFGQTLDVEFTKQNNSVIEWKSFDKQQNEWFKASISQPNFIVLESTNPTIAIQLIRFLINAKHLNPIFLKNSGLYEVQNYLDFDLEDGFGSSSTLTNNIAQWANVNPYSLHFNAFKGSGFDVAVAEKNQAILYQMNGNQPIIKPLEWSKSFQEQLFFIHLNKKQNSRTQIYKQNNLFSKEQIDEISRISNALTTTENVEEFCLLLEMSENITSQVLKTPTIKQDLFPDFKGSIKSLGAWGGDYILAIGADIKTYFTKKGYSKIYNYKDLILG